MNKLTKYILGLGVFSIIITGSYFFTNNNTIKEIELDANYVYTVGLEEMGDFADLIVLGTPTENFEDRKFEVSYFPKDPRDTSNTPPAIENIQSYTKFYVEEIYKDEINSNSAKVNEITIVEPVALLDDAPDKTKISLGSYDELESESKYVLFLKKSPNDGYYYVVRDNEGMKKITNEQNPQKEVLDFLQKHNVKN